MIACDTSAIMAVLLNEPDADRFRYALATPRKVYLSAGTLLELRIVVSSKSGPAGVQQLKHLLALMDRETVPFDVEQAEIAADAYKRFGRNSGSPAKLNFGDCFAYALARTLRVPLLFKGDDFTHTDIPAVLSLS